MLKIRDTLVSDEALEARFACDLPDCRGACCQVGDAGAPLSEGEAAAITEVLPALLDGCPDRSRPLLERGDVFEEGGRRLRCFPDGACVLSFPGPAGTVGCQLERAARAGRIDFPKPIFCHLFPLKVEWFYDQAIVRLERRPECSPGFGGGTGLLEFSRPALERWFGRDWYQALEAGLPAAREHATARRRRHG